MTQEQEKLDRLQLRKTHLHKQRDRLDRHIAKIDGEIGKMTSAIAEVEKHEKKVK